MSDSTTNTPSRRSRTRSVTGTPAHLKVYDSPKTVQREVPGVDRDENGQFISRMGRRRPRRADPTSGCESEEEQHLRKKTRRKKAAATRNTPASDAVLAELRRDREEAVERERRRLEDMEAMLNRQLEPMRQIGRNLNATLRALIPSSNMTEDV
jgi:hypothetical protein